MYKTLGDLMADNQKVLDLLDQISSLVDQVKSSVGSPSEKPVSQMTDQELEAGNVTPTEENAPLFGPVKPKGRIVG